MPLFGAAGQFIVDHRLEQELCQELEIGISIEIMDSCKIPDDYWRKPNRKLIDKIYGFYFPKK
jgi:hypothetical protein